MWLDCMLPETVVSSGDKAVVVVDDRLAPAPVDENIPDTGWLAPVSLTGQICFSRQGLCLELWKLLKQVEQGAVFDLFFSITLQWGQEEGCSLCLGLLWFLIPKPALLMVVLKL